MKKLLPFARYFIVVQIAAAIPAWGQASDNMVTRKLDELAENLVNSFVSGITSGSSVIAVNDFQNLGQEASDLHIGETVGELLSRAFMASPRVTVAERKNLANLLNEMSLVEAGVVSDDGAVEAGRALGAEYMVLGSVARLGSYFSVNGRVVNTSTAKVVAAGYVEIDANYLIVTSSDLFTPRKNQLLAAFMSLVPGGGQLFNGKPGKALFYLASVGGSLIASRILYDDSKFWYDRYLARGRKSVEAYEVAELSFDNSQIWLAAAAGIWAWNMLDAFWDAGELSRKIRKAKKQLKAQN